MLTVFYGRFSLELLSHATRETLRVSAFVVMIAALCYAFVGIFMNAGSGDVVSSMIMAVPGGKWASFAMIMLIVFLLGLFIEWIGIVFIIVPIFSPILETLGFNPLWGGHDDLHQPADGVSDSPHGHVDIRAQGCSPSGTRTHHVRYYQRGDSVRSDHHADTGSVYRFSGNHYLAAGKDDRTVPSLIDEHNEWKSIASKMKRNHRSGT